MAADSLDIGVSAGPELALVEKGAPVKGVAMPFGPPVYLVMLVRPDSTSRSAADLKGRKIDVSSIRSLTGWLLFELSRQQGWGARGIELVGSPPRTSLAAIKTRQIDGMVTDITFALRAEQAGEGKILLSFGDLVRISTRTSSTRANKLIAQQARRDPQIPRRLVRHHRVHAREQGRDRQGRHGGAGAAGGDREPDLRQLMPVFSTDGKFDDKALATLSRSFVELELLPSEPKDMQRLYHGRVSAEEVTLDRSDILGVVPAQAGTHNHLRFEEIIDRATSRRHSVWVPACAGTTAESVQGYDSGEVGGTNGYLRRFSFAVNDNAASAAARAAHGDEDVLLLLLVEIGAVEHRRAPAARTGRAARSRCVST